MSEVFFPASGQRVVPLFKINDNDEVTAVHTPKSMHGHGDPKISILRIVIGSLFRATVIHIEPDPYNHMKRE